MINFSLLSPSSFPGKILRSLLRLVPRGVRVPIMQGKLRGMKWIVGAGDNNGFWLGSYEYDTQKVFEQYVGSGKVVYDIGANAGFYTLLSSVLTGEKGKVIAIEPLPENVIVLNKHLSLNRINNVTVMEAAVWSSEGWTSFTRGRNAAEGALSEEGDLKVRTVSIDSLVFKDRMPPPDVIKLDAEGAEGDALEGAEKVLRTYSPVIILSTHGHSEHERCLRFLRAMDYELRSIDPSLPVEESPSLVGVKL